MPGQKPLPELLVTGEYPGPALWRISKGNHDLWILATLAPLPEKLKWRSRAVEARIAKSQVVFAPPENVLNMRVFAYYASEWNRALKNPGGKSLAKVLPPETYTRWVAAKEKYLGSYDEHERPLVAANDLFHGALHRTGLTNDDFVWQTVENFAQHQNIKITRFQIKMNHDRPMSWIRDLATPRPEEVTCLEMTIDRLNTDIGPMRRRANQWSVGDIESLLAEPLPDDRITCFNILYSTPQMHSQLETAENMQSDEWLAAADKALNSNVSTFAVLPISEMVKSGGWLDKLQAKGYVIHQP